LKRLLPPLEANDRRDLLLLGLIWLFHACANTVWLLLDNFPPTWDSAHHLTMTLKWLEFLQSPSILGLKVVAASSSYPPLPYLVVSPFYIIFGKNPDVAVLSSGILWLGLLLLAVYGIGREIFNRKAGLFAALIISLYPIIIALERDFWLDLQLTAAVALALWALLRVNNFDQQNRSIMLGLTLGFGTWIKWPFSFFMVAPLLAAIIQVWRQEGWSKQRLTNLGVTVLVAGILAASQYLFNLLFLPRDIYNLKNVLQLVTGFAQAAEHPPWYTPQGLVYNFSALVNHQASLFFTLLFLLSLPFFLRKDVKGRLILILGLLVPYLLATLLPTKEQRITVPYLSIVAVITGVGLAKIRRHTFQTFAIALVVCYGIFQWWTISWGIPQLADHLYWGNSWVYFAVFDQHPVRSPRDYSLQPVDWKLDELLDVIELDAAVNEIPLPTVVPVIANAPAYNPNTLNYYSLLKDSPVQFIYVWSWSGDPISLEDYPYTYLVWKQGLNTEIEGWDQQDVRRAEEYLANHRSSFNLIYQTQLPDGSQVLVFRQG
jgi:4-amino-4-deoxy-L-arabinose transferase-like glycosyltransferase